MAKQIGNTIAGLDVGNMVRSRMRVLRVTHAVLARRVKRSQSTVKEILYNTSIQTYLIWELSVALNHNFFADLSAQLNAATQGKLQQEATEMDRLKNENQRLREERDYLRKAMDLIKG